MSTSPYHESGKLLNQVLTQHKSLKNIVFSSSLNKVRCKKSTYATVCNTLKHKCLIDSILDHNHGSLRRSIHFDETRNKGLLYVLLHELLFGKFGNIRGGGQLKKNVMKLEKELRKAKHVVMKAAPRTELSESPEFPRYVRVNTLKINSVDAIKILQRDFCHSDSNNGGEVGKDGEEGTAQIFADRHVPDLLVLPHRFSAKLHDHELVKSGKIILQDKSSCFPALALVHGDFSKADVSDCGDYIDACAAPGNKTTHLAALVSQKMEQGSLISSSAKGTKSNRGDKEGPQSGSSRRKIFAFDRSSSRISLLRDRLSILIPLDSKNIVVDAIHQDFLKVDPSNKRFARVRCILLDPSCSGSGIVNSPDRYADAANSADEDHNKKRLQSLANFQLVALKHAMAFPQVDRIVYSTCSLHEQENENVVLRALDEYNNETNDESMRWEVVSPDCLKHWKRRGKATDGLTEAQVNSLIRCDGMEGDETNGFFVSYFERRGVGGNERHEKDITLVTTPDGVDIYNGEFNEGKRANASKCISKVPKTASFREKGRTFECHGAKEEEKKMPKKKAKKLAWKRKQMELKNKRLKEKKKKGTARNTPETP